MSDGLRMTEDQLAAYQERQRKWSNIGLGATYAGAPALCEPADPGPESKLQDKIERYCEEHGYLWFHLHKPKGNKPGLPDMLIWMPKSRHILLELKSKTGGLSEEQKKWKRMALFMGHEWHEVRSYRQFLRIVEGAI